jgi:hypothetical protein
MTFDEIADDLWACSKSRSKAAKAEFKRKLKLIVVDSATFGRRAGVQEILMRATALLEKEEEGK